MRKYANKICVEMAETSGKMVDFSGIPLPVNIVNVACIKGQKDCPSLNLMHVFRSIKVGCPSKTLNHSISSSLREQH